MKTATRKQTPLLLRPELVKKVLDGTKTMTRRPLREQPTKADWGQGFFVAGHGYWNLPDNCPYGQPGDLLWVRETWRVGAWDHEDGTIAVDYKADNFSRREWLTVPGEPDEMFERLWLQSCDDADKAGREIHPDVSSDGGYRWNPGESPCRWRPSIHMPKWACRLWLEITEVRVERIQDLSTADVQREGYTPFPKEPSPTGWLKKDFALSWNATYPGSWDRNDWVWCISFKKTRGPKP